MSSKELNANNATESATGTFATNWVFMVRPLKIKNGVVGILNEKILLNKI
jgi:hypothetical protein